MRILSDDPVDLRGHHAEVGRLGTTYVSNKSGRNEVYIGVRVQEQGQEKNPPGEQLDHRERRKAANLRVSEPFVSQGPNAAL